MSQRYLDDFTIGDKFTTAGATITAEMIIDFALTYDPQPFHIDAEAARHTNFGGLIASGFQTLALGFRLIWDTGLLRDASMGSPGFDELRWLKPVRPDDTIHVEGEVVESRPSSSKPDRGIVRIYYRYLNQKGEVVLTYTAMHLLRRRGF
jgi:acyl dehydratase